MICATAAQSVLAAVISHVATHAQPAVLAESAAVPATAAAVFGVARLRGTAAGTFLRAHRLRATTACGSVAATVGRTVTATGFAATIAATAIGTAVTAAVQDGIKQTHKIFAPS